MTPADHYAEAERLAAEAKNHLAQQNVNWIRANSLVALAGVHARLANVDPDVLWPQRVKIECPTCLTEIDVP